MAKKYIVELTADEKEQLLDLARIGSHSLNSLSSKCYSYKSSTRRIRKLSRYSRYSLGTHSRTLNSFHRP